MCSIIVEKLLELKRLGYDPWLQVRQQPHITEEMWMNYETLFSEFEMPEQVMLREAEKSFVVVFKRIEKEIGREYKKIFRAKRTTDNKLTTGKQTRSKKTRTIESNL